MGKRSFILTLFIFFAVCVFTKSAMAADVPRMTKDDLKALIGSPDLVILDVRARTDWETSDLKIKDAIREDPNGIESWSDKYPKDKTLVLYCA